MVGTPKILTSLHGSRIGLGPNGELIVEGSRVTNPRQNGGPFRQAPGFIKDPSYAFEMFDDFLQPASATMSDLMAWTVGTDGASGTDAFQDAAGGVVNLVTAAADNDYKAWSSVAENFKFALGKELYFEARFKLAEATVLESTWWFGFTDTLTTGGMQANAAGPLASYDGALIFKTPETAMTVNFETSNAGTQNTLSEFATAVTDTWTKVGMWFDGIDTIHPFIDVGNGSGWAKGTGQGIVLTGLEEMHLVFGVKAGPTAAAETLQVDYVKAVQLR
jgi:hypothetical protein